MSLNLSLSLRLDLTPVPASRPRVPRYGKPYYMEPYRGYMVTAARVLAPVSALGPSEPLSGPLVALFGFQLPRPPSHYRQGRNAHLLKADAPILPIKPRSGDLDNFAKSILDALQSAGLLADDSLVLDLACSKRYGGPGRTDVQLKRADPGADPFGCFLDAV